MILPYKSDLHPHDHSRFIAQELKLFSRENLFYFLLHEYHVWHNCPICGIWFACYSECIMCFLIYCVIWTYFTTYFISNFFIHFLKEWNIFKELPQKQFNYKVPTTADVILQADRFPAHFVSGELDARIYVQKSADFPKVIDVISFLLWPGTRFANTFQ